MLSGVLLGNRQFNSFNADTLMVIKSDTTNNDYISGIGPVRASYHNYAYFDGTFPSTHTTDRNVGLVASSLRGDTVDHDLEIESNDSPALSQALDFDIPVYGDTLSLDSRDAIQSVQTATRLPKVPYPRVNPWDAGRFTGSSGAWACKTLPPYLGMLTKLVFSLTVASK